ncbi:MAG: CNNM domain-containing protein [Salinivirgaceae bacterium]|nr:CNNM domain-containing protein [Salinivirgaceae bacterium]
MMNDALIWIGIFFCLTQSAMFSGLNLAFFSFTRLRLEIEAESAHSKGATKVLNMRDDSNFLLTTILWGNVGINVLLTLLSDSVMAGIVSFMFSTVLITLFGEIVPQAYFSRNSLKMASLLSPVLRIYQFVLYPVAKPSALLLDAWLGKESVEFFKEKNIKLFLKKHIEGSDNEIDHIEGTGAINFLSLDDILVADEGENINKHSIIALNEVDGELVFPNYNSTTDDIFIQKINKSNEKWIIFTNQTGIPKAVLDADGFIRSTLFCKGCESIQNFCHTPLVIYDNNVNLGMVLKDLHHKIDKHNDLPIEKDIVLLWSLENKKIITGADIFGRLLKGI